MSGLGIGFGVVLVGLGLFFLVRTSAFLRGAANADGRVVGLEHHPGSQEPTYKPVVEYTTPDGEVRRFTEPIRSSRPGCEVGDRVAVKYDPSRPDRARLNKPFRLWFLPGLLLFLGATSLAADLLA
jgi:hypothetical protein